jgi:hypothetical protein
MKNLVLIDGPSENSLRIAYWLAVWAIKFTAKYQSSIIAAHSNALKDALILQPQSGVSFPALLRFFTAYHHEA